MFFITFDMSRGIVSQRQVSHKKHKHAFKRMLNRSGVSLPEIHINPIVKKVISRWMLVILVLILWIFILIKSLFFKPTQTISEVRFSEVSQSTFQDQDLFHFISSQAKWQNYFIFTSNKDSLLAKIQSWFTVKWHSWEDSTISFPFVWWINFQLEAPDTTEINENNSITIWVQIPYELPVTNFQAISWEFPLKLGKDFNEWWILWVEIMYYEPKVLVKLNWKKFAVWDESTFVELKEWMSLSLTKVDPNCDESKEDCMLAEIFTIETPMYLTWTTSLNWLFFELSLSNLLTIIPLAKEAFPNMKRFVYLAWSTRIAIFTVDDKVLYFNFTDDSPIEDQWNTQLTKYILLKENYANFNRILTIDLSLENNKAIIKNS